MKTTTIVLLGLAIVGAAAYVSMAQRKTVGALTEAIQQGGRGDAFQVDFGLRVPK